MAGIDVPHQRAQFTDVAPAEHAAHDVNPTACGVTDCAEQAEQGRFARAVGTE